MSEPPSRKRGLGMGLSALLGGEVEGLLGGRAPQAGQTMPIELLRPSPYQPRRHFAEDELDSLAESLRRHGLLQPLLVRPVAGSAGSYEIVAGERRWRAAQRAGLHEVPVLVRELDDRDTLAVALIENLQRQDLSPLDEAEGFRRLTEEFSLSQEALAETVGKSRSHVANMMRLLALPEAVRDHLSEKRLTAGHARALLGSTEPVRLAAEVIAKDLNVRQTEALVRAKAREPVMRTAKVPDADLAAFEELLSRRFGLVVKVTPAKRGGTLAIGYSSLAQLEEFINRFR